LIPAALISSKLAAVSRLTRSSISAGFIGIEPMPMKPAEMDDLVKRETAANFELIKAAGIKP